MAKATEAQKAKKFQELAEKRMTKILRGIEGLSKLAVPARYSYTPKQVQTMGDALNEALKSCFAGFSGGGSAKGGGFKF